MLISSINRYLIPASAYDLINLKSYLLVFILIPNSLCSVEPPTISAALCVNAAIL